MALLWGIKCGSNLSIVHNITLNHCLPAHRGWRLKRKSISQAIQSTHTFWLCSSILLLFSSIDVLKDFASMLRSEFRPTRTFLHEMARAKCGMTMTSFMAFSAASALARDCSSSELPNADCCRCNRFHFARVLTSSITSSGKYCFLAICTEVAQSSNPSRIRPTNIKIYLSLSVRSIYIVESTRASVLSSNV